MMVVQRNPFLLYRLPLRDKLWSPCAPHHLAPLGLLFYVPLVFASSFPRILTWVPSDPQLTLLVARWTTPYLHIEPMDLWSLLMQHRLHSVLNVWALYDRLFGSWIWHFQHWCQDQLYSHGWKTPSFALDMHYHWGSTRVQSFRSYGIIRGI